MRFARSSGLLLHPTSLPGRYGIGELGREALAFVDLLVEARQSVWQVLPIGPTGYGDSPYQCFSAFAGNPLLISLDALADRGYLVPGDLDPPSFPADNVDYGAVIAFKSKALAAAHAGFRQRATRAEHEAFDVFRNRHARWLRDFALFMAIKEAHNKVSWTEWERGAALRDPDVLQSWRGRLASQIEAHEYWQFEFFRQWEAVKRYANDRGVRIMGDIPIYVAHDSADVWAHRGLFWLNEDGTPALIAGVPPDYFSTTGQCWGNPIYRWDRMAADGFAWWIERFRDTLALFDIARLDHFRGFEAYWAVPGCETTAVNGTWVKGPGAALFDAVEKALGQLPIVAENLGVITPEVEGIRARFGYPGMAILQFAFGNDPQAPDFQPHNYPRELAAYTGTHDNDTVMGWWNSTGGDSVRSDADIAKEKKFARRYLATDGADMNWVMIRTLLASVANTAVVPMQDLLGLGSEARMNTPSKPSGNWRWRMLPGALTPQIVARLREWCGLYGRAARH